MSELAPLLDHLDADHDAAVKRMCDLLSIPSVSTDPAYANEVRKAASWISADLEALKFETRSGGAWGR